MWKHDYKNLVVVSPDVGGVVRARALAKRLEADLAIIDKRRPRPNVATVMNIIGEVEGRTCVIIDDMVDTANTLCEAAGALKKQGAEKVLAYCTHPVLSGPAIERICEFGARRTGGDRHHSAARGGGKCERIRVLSWRNCWPKPCAASATRIRSVRCSWNRFLRRPEWFVRFAAF